MAARKSAIPITLRMMSCSWRNRSPDEAKRNPGMNAMPTPDIAPLIRATILPSLRAQEKSSSLPLPAMTIETGIANGKGNDSSGNSPRSVPVRQGLLRDRYAGTLAWHDHSAASLRAHGSAYATYVGSWRKRFRIIKGKAGITRFEDEAAKTVRSFCARCGMPLFYERARSPHVVNIPRALFAGRTGRQPLYHLAIEERQGWAYTRERRARHEGCP